MNDTESDSDPEVGVQFSKAKSRSPPKHRLQEISGISEDIFQPLVDGDEFEEQELEGNALSFVSAFFASAKDSC